MMRRVISVSLLVLGVMGASRAVQGATISAAKQGYVSIVGEIVPGDELTLANELKTFTEASPREVRLDSPGGSVQAGLALAELVHNAGLIAHVPYRGQCYSACVIIFAAARDRIANAESMIGVHSAGQGSEENGATFAVTTVIARVMAKYGAPPSVIGKMVMTPNQGMTTLTIADLEAWRVTISRELAYREAPQAAETGSIPKTGSIPQLSSPSPSVTAEQMMRFVVGTDNSIERAMQFYHWPWDEKVRYLKSVGGQYNKICFRPDDCIHQTEALTSNRKYGYAVRSNPRIDEKAFCVTSYERGRKACYNEGSGEVLFLHSSEGKWKKVARPVALSMID